MYLTFVYFIPENGHTVVRNMYERIVHINYFFTMSQALVGQGFLIIEDSWSHSVGILWTNEQPDTEISAWPYTKLTRDINVCPGGIRTSNPSIRAAADPRLRPRGHWDRQTDFNVVYLYAFIVTTIFYTKQKYLQKTKRNLRQVYEIRSGYVGLYTINPFLGAFAKLQKETISFVVSVHPYVLSHGTTRLPLHGVL
jgi:hypothetical protein